MGRAARQAHVARSARVRLSARRRRGISGRSGNDDGSSRKRAKSRIGLDEPPEAFRNPGRGKELALSQYQSGVNIIFHASGSTGLGVFEAARSSRKLAIGVDADQYAEAPGFILTSMVKGVDAAVYDAIRRAKDGSFRGGIYQFGLAEGGVGYVYDANNKALIPDSVRARLDTLQSDIVARKIAVPSTR